MVAIIKTSSSLSNVLHYNENKLKENEARLIHSMNFAKDTNQLGFTDKLKTIEKLVSLNQRTKLHATHISLNFDPSEKLDKTSLQKIAESYMQKIGFGDQPYLVYEHLDAGHPHLHIVSTNIQRDGKAIKMFNIGRNQSEKARKEIEKEFNLVRADGKQTIAYELKPINATKVQYGKAVTKRAITNVLTAVLTDYKYASIPELNAILKLYNMVADRGSENSRTFKGNGLVYRVLDQNGRKVGAPIKASAIYNNPGMIFLQQRFEKNEQLKQPFKKRVKNAVALYFLQHQNTSVTGLIDRLQKENINVILRQNANGIIYGITYVDMHKKCVFNGSDLGKEYSANRIQQRCTIPSPTIEQKPLLTITTKQDLKSNFISQQPIPLSPSNSSGFKEIMRELLQIEQEGSLAAELRNEEIKRKKKRKIHH